MKNGLLIFAVFLTLLLGGCGDNNKNTDEDASENKQDAEVSNTQDPKILDQQDLGASDKKAPKTSNQRISKTTTNVEDKEDEEADTPQDFVDEAPQNVQEPAPTVVSETSSWKTALAGVYTGVADTDYWFSSGDSDLNNVPVQIQISYQNPDDEGDDRFIFVVERQTSVESGDNFFCTFYGGLAYRHTELRESETIEHFTFKSSSSDDRYGAIHEADRVDPVEMTISSVSGLNLSIQTQGAFPFTSESIKELRKTSNTTDSYEDLVIKCNF